MDSRRWNYLIEAVNNNWSPEDVNPPMNDEELEIFKNMGKDLAELCKKYGDQRMFSPVELDW